jgi:hypothetical protein
MRSCAYGIGGALLGFSLLVPAPAGRAQDFEVDLALVLAIDCSFSVDAREFNLQMEGMGRAFMRDEVKRVIAQGQRQRIAVAIVQWSDDINQKVVLPWTVISGPADADELGQIILNSGRQLAEGGTSISAALVFSAALFASAPSAERRVIDVSSDGRNNSGPPVKPVRDRLVVQGLTVNGLTILNEWPTLDVYFENNVVGGANNFVMPADAYEDYEDAIYRKLLREITGPGVS